MTAAATAVARLGEDFLAQAFGRAYSHLPAALPVDDLLTWQALNDIIARHRLQPPRLRLSTDGRMLPQHEYTVPVTTRRHTVWHRIQPAALHRHLADGATLVLDAVDELHPGVEDLARALEHVVRTGVQVNAYASWTPAEGFGVHWDDHDVVVVQLDGAKRWRLYGPTRTAPMYRDTATPEPPPDEPVADFVLRPGDLLYLPRGWWHAVTASEGVRSLHLTCGMQAATGADLITWLSETLREHDTVRQDLPRFGTAEEKHAYIQQIRRLLESELADGGLIDRFLASRDATEQARLRPSLPHLGRLPADAEGTVRLLTARHRVERDADGNAVLRAGGQEFVLAPAAGPLLDLLADGRTHRLDTLAETSGLPVEQVAGVVEELVDGQIAALGGPR